MNYLGHLFLAGNEEDSIVGNYLGDFIKGKLDEETFDTGVLQGIKMHRKIDALADERIISVLNKNKLAFSHRRYAGITFDLACDHFLAKHWQVFSRERHHDFAQSRLAILKNNQESFNQKARFVLTRMEDYAWLTNYQHLDFIAEVFEGIHRRFPKQNRINEAFEDLSTHYSELEEICMTFITELLQHEELLAINQKHF